MFKNWQLLKDDPAKKEKFFQRAKIVSLIRDFFVQEDFLEVETPSLVRLPGMEPYLDPVKTELVIGGKAEGGYLVTSPEYAMKKLLAAGFPKIFQICKSFRGGEEAGRLHNPEFTILEWYRAGADYRNIMEDVENMFRHIAGRFGNGSSKIVYQGREIDFSPPWPKITVREAFQNYAKIDLDTALDRDSLFAAAAAKGYKISPKEKFDDVFFKIFLNEIEPCLNQAKPVIVYDWPAGLAALSRKKAEDPRYAERFEVYAGGLELGNAFSELTDPEEQKERLLEEREQRVKSGKNVYGIDEDFIAALSSGMPASGGIAMGVDRIVMLFTDSKNIGEIQFFPAKDIF